MTAVKFLVAAGLAALLAACGGPQTPIVRITGDAKLAASWALPEAKHGDLLYVSNVEESAPAVYFLSYPAGKLVGTIDFSGATPTGMCVDKEQDVWITADHSAIQEYAHGGTSRIGYVDGPGGDEYRGCAFDRTTGNLAAASLNGDIAIFAGAQGTPAVYTDSELQRAVACGYDDKGNLYVVGFGNGSGFAFAELPKGSSELTNITLDKTIHAPGGVRWDGKHVDVSDAEEGVIYQTNGARGHVVGATYLDIDIQLTTGQFWIQGSKVVVAVSDGVVGYWSYPAGGYPIKTLSGFGAPFGTVISKGTR
jgi:hypothetical protein